MRRVTTPARPLPGVTTPTGPPPPRVPAWRRGAGLLAGLLAGLALALGPASSTPSAAQAAGTYEVLIESSGDGAAAVLGGATAFPAGATVRLLAEPGSEATVWGGWTSPELGWIGARVDEFAMPDGDVHLTTSFRDRAAPLTEVYADDFETGNIWKGPQSYTDPDSSEVLARDAGVMTAENAMKPSELLANTDITGTGEFAFRWETADQFLADTAARGARVHGHVLVWHSQSPARLNSGETGGTRAKARANMEEYIKQVLTRYSGRIPTWDVVNEAFVDSISTFDPATDAWEDFLRGSPRGGQSNWYAVYADGADPAAGESAGDFIYDAFVLARQYGPEVTLEYNDFNLFESGGKARAVVAMATELNARYATEHPEDPRPLIEAIGMQSHDYINQTPAFACSGSRVAGLVDAGAAEWQPGACSDSRSLEASIRLFQDAGLEVAISELDLQVFESWDGMPQGVDNNDLADYRDLTDPSARDLFHREGADYWVGRIGDRAELEAIQAQRYAEFFRVFQEYADGIERVTFWGITDAGSWRRNHNPLTRNQDYSEKLSAWAVADPVGWLTRDDVEPEPEPEPQPERVLAATVSATEVARGGTLDVSGTGATPGGTIRVELHSDVVVLGAGTVDAAGTFALTVRVPAHVPPGAHTLVLVDEASGVEWSAAVTVTGAATPDPDGSGNGAGAGGGSDGGSPAAVGAGLAVTGAAAWAVAAAAAGLLLAGGGSVLLSRRRRA